MQQHRLFVFVAVMAVTTALWAPGRAGAVDAGSPRAAQGGSQHGALREAATGTWTGEFGTLVYTRA